MYLRKLTYMNGYTWHFGHWYISLVFKKWLWYIVFIYTFPDDDYRFVYYLLGLGRSHAHGR